VNKGHEVARGKTKVLYEHAGQPDVLVVQQGDGITAGDGARRNEIPGKGRIAAKTTARIFRLLNLCGLPTHYLSGGEDDDDNETLVRRCTMIPLEVVVRGVAAGSFVRRKPGVARGSIIVPRLVEFFLKDDANHDPLIEPEEIVARGIASPQEIGAMGEIARIAFEILAHAWRRRETLLVDMKVEFGRLASGEGRGNLVIADVIDNDSWRIWPQGREELMLDKQIYRNLADVTPADLERVKAAYERVADQVASFPASRSATVALMVEGNEYLKAADLIAQALGRYGIPTLRRIVSPILLPNHAATLVQQLDATFARLVFVPVGLPGGALYPFLDHATSTPVIDGSILPADSVALACAKQFGFDDSILFGRVLLMQANERSAVAAADAHISAAPPASGGTLA
jgi:phosphoribosylaminoimidazole-succinocarboxamide synthase